MGFARFPVSGEPVYHPLGALLSSLRRVWRLNGAWKKTSKSPQPAHPQHPIGDLFGFSYNPPDRTTRKRAIAIPDINDDALAIYCASRPSAPAPVTNETQGANLCAIEIILQKIWNGWKASV